MQDLLSAGVHFGHQVRRGHPKMMQYLYGARDGVHIIDLAKSEEKLKEAVDFVFNLGKEGKVLLVVGTKKQAREIVEGLSKEVDTYYITERWLGGLLTNFDEVRRNIKKLNDLKVEKEKGELSRYTKKEQLLIDKKLSKFDKELGGVAKMDRVPDALFVVDPVSEKTAIKEAQRKGVRVVAFADSNCDPNSFDFPIPANDDGIKSIKIICETIIKAYGEGKKSSQSSVVNQPSDKQQPEDKKLDEAVVEEAAAIEEVVEQKAVKEAERKVE